MTGAACRERIDVTSSAAAGTAFTVRLPRHHLVPSGKPILDPAHVESEGAPPYRPARLLAKCANRSICPDVQTSRLLFLMIELIAHRSAHVVS